MKLTSALSVAFLFVLSGCAMTEEDKARYQAAQEKVTVADALTATEAQNLREVGPVNCRVYWKNFYDEPVDNCRKSLKSDAYKLGATLVVIESRKTFKCEVGDKSADCIEMKGRAYVQRQPSVP